MSKEAMKLALEALEKLMRFESDSWELGSCRVASQAIKALREALANEALDKMAENARELGLDYEPAQQEPVAYWIPKAEQFCIASLSGRPFAKAWEPLYTSPPAQRTWVGLTDEEVDDLSREMVKGKKSVNWLSYSIEAKLKEKNT